MKYYK